MHGEENPAPHPGAGSDAEAVPHDRSWRSRNVVGLGLVSLLTDTATEMAIPLLPTFLVGVLRAGPLMLGTIEGGADALASVFKLVAGRWADRLGRYRPLVLAGYTLSSVVRPLLALAGAPWHVLAVRLVDRTGKGLRSSPRDALITASVHPSQQGAAFGLHRAMDHAGAVLGPILAVVALAIWSQDLRWVFTLTALPGVMAVLCLLLFVKEAQTEPKAEGLHSPESASRDVRRSGDRLDEPRTRTRSRSELARFLVPLGLFTLGNASDVFLLLKAGAERAPLMTLPLLWMGLHLVKMASSVPGGKLADRLGPRRVIILGWLVYVAVYIGFAFASSPRAVVALFVVYGLYHGLTESPEKALVARLAPKDRRGTTFGWFHLVQGMLALAASLLFGGLWELFDSRTAFLTSAGLAAAATVALVVLAPMAARGRDAVA